MEKQPFSLLLQNAFGYLNKDSGLDGSINMQDCKHQIAKGSLLTALSHQETESMANSFDPPHNYKYVSSDLTLTLHCKPDQVHPLTVTQRALLVGVTQESDRVEVLHKLDWAAKLKPEDHVYVTISSIPVPVEGVVRYIGPLKEGGMGINFGIELLVRT